MPTHLRLRMPPAAARSPRADSDGHENPCSVCPLPSGPRMAASTETVGECMSGSPMVRTMTSSPRSRADSASPCRRHAADWQPSMSAVLGARRMVYHPWVGGFPAWHIERRHVSQGFARSVWTAAKFPCVLKYFGLDVLCARVHPRTPVMLTLSQFFQQGLARAPRGHSRRRSATRPGACAACA